MRRIASAFILILAAPYSASAGERILGAGATFPAPLYIAWSEKYRESSGVNVDYDGVGSGAGIERIRARRVNFGASDSPLSPDELASDGLLQFPAAIGGVVPVVNIRGIKPGELKLSGSLLADIYLGRVHKWNDSAIAALNPQLRLPNANITVVHRNEKSGTSLLWSEYLSQVSALWKSNVGASLIPHWPTGVGGVGNDGIASYVQRTRFAIGYVEYIYARQHRLSDVSILNRSGNFVRADRESFDAAVKASAWPGADGIAQIPSDPLGANSWPITGATFVLIEASPTQGAQTHAVLQFFDWALHQGRTLAQSLHYEPVPASVVERLPSLWHTIHDVDGKSVWP